MSDLPKKPFLSQLWIRLTEPDASIREPEQRHQAQFLATAFLLIMPTGIIGVALPAISNHESLFTLKGFYVYLSAAVVGGIAYYLSRTKWYQIASWIAVLASALVIFLAAFANQTTGNTQGLFYLIISVVLGGILLSIRATTVIAVCEIVGIILLPTLFPSANWEANLAQPLAFNIIVSLVVILVAHHRDLAEQDRQNTLEQRIVSRTKELTDANEKLKNQILEREAAEKALANERNLLGTLIDNLPDYIVVKDNQNRFVLVNKAWASHNTDSDQTDRVIGKTDYDYFSTDLANEFLADERQLLQSGQALIDKEEINLPAEQTIRWMLTSKVPLRDSVGQISGLVGISRDITLRKQMEASLQKAHDELEQRVIERTEALSQANSELQFQVTERLQAEIAEREQRLLAEALRDTASAINSTLDLQEVLDRILIQIERVIPYDSASIMLLDDGVAYVVHGRGYIERGFKMEDLLAVRFVINETENLRTMYETGQPLVIFDMLQYPAWQQVEQSTWIHSYIGAPISTGDQVIGYINLDNAQVGEFSQDQARKLGAFANQAAIAIRNARLYDVAKGYATELEARVAERTSQLERQRAQLQSILDSMHEGVVGIMFGPDMRPQTHLMNRVMVTLTGYEPEEWDFNLLRSQDLTEAESAEVIQGYQRAMEKIGFWQKHLKVRRKDGSEFDGELTVTRVSDLDGKMIGIVIVIRDVSQEKILQEQRSRFVANASHELRTPITNLLTRLYLLRKQPERLPEHLEILESVAGRMRDLVEDLLEHSRFERGVIPLRQEEIDLRLPVIDVIHIQQPEADVKHIQLSYQVSKSPLLALVDPGRMIQVFTNLITNAINYTPDGGQVHIDCYSEIHSESTSPTVILRVQDSGIGIKPDLLLNIFRPFYRGNEHTNGTGLGLSIAKEIVEMHGGTISVESEVGKGSCFTVRLALVNSG